MEDIVVNGNPGSYQFGNAALYNGFGCFGVFQLVANGYALPGTHQFRQISIQRMMGKACQLDMRGSAVGPACKYDAQNTGSFNGIFAKGLIKIAYAKQQQSTGVLYFDSIILLH